MHSFAKVRYGPYQLEIILDLLYRYTYISIPHALSCRDLSTERIAKWFGARNLISGSNPKELIPAKTGKFGSFVVWNRIVSGQPSSKSSLFFGWYILCACFIILFFQSGARCAFSVMFKPMLADLGWNRFWQNGQLPAHFCHFGRHVSDCSWVCSFDKRKASSSFLTICSH